MVAASVRNLQWLGIILFVLGITALISTLRLGIFDQLLHDFYFSAVARGWISLSFVCVGVMTMPTQFLLLVNAVAFILSFRRGLLDQQSLQLSVLQASAFWLLNGAQCGCSMLLMARFAPLVRLQRY